MLQVTFVLGLLTIIGDAGKTQKQIMNGVVLRAAAFHVSGILKTIRMMQVGSSALVHVTSIRHYSRSLKNPMVISRMVDTAMEYFIWLLTSLIRRK